MTLKVREYVLNVFVEENKLSSLVEDMANFGFYLTSDSFNFSNRKYDLVFEGKKIDLALNFIDHQRLFRTCTPRLVNQNG